MKPHVLAALLLAASPALAQSTARPAQAAPEAQPPVFRSGVDLVRVDIRVTDDNGNAITDLKPDEIQIREEGAVRPVLLFQHVAAPHGTYAEAAVRTVAAEVSTNQGSPHGHVYVLVFDEAHIEPARAQRARRAAESFLRTRVGPGDRVALYALPGPGPQIGFTADVARVIKALRLVRGAAEETGMGPTIGLRSSMRIDQAYEIVRGNQQVLDRVANEASASHDAGADVGPTTRFDTEDTRDDMLRAITEDARLLVNRADGDSRRLLLSLADVVRTLRQVDGRKAVILFSEGFQIDNVTHELERVAAAAAESYSVVYGMDLNPRGVEASQGAPLGGETATATLDRLQSIGSLAADTGGDLVTDAAGQLDRALARIAANTEDYYLVGFVPGTRDQSERYRHIKVTVSRPGAHVSARTGYASGPAATPADKRRSIEAALAAPFSQQGLRVEYTTYVLRGSAPDTQRVILSLAAELPVAATDDARADVVYVVRSVETGKVAASGSDTTLLPDAPDHPGATVGTGLYRVQFELPPGTYLMRAVVREPHGLVGSADRRFRVRALDAPDVTASDLVLGSTDVAGLPVRAAAYASDVLNGVFELYARSAAQLDGVDVLAELMPIGRSEDVVAARADLEPLKSGGERVSRGVHVELPLSGVSPGEYLVRATVRKGTDTVAELLRDVTVHPGQRPPAAPAVATAVQPQVVLRGELARRLVDAVKARAAGEALSQAADAASSGNWPGVDAALASSAPESADALMMRGLSAFAKADYEAAAKGLRAAQTAGARDPALSFVLGWTLAGAGDDAAAITAWRAAVFDEPTLIPAYLALADTYVRLEHSELAEQVVRSGLRILPDSVELRDRLARLQGGGF